MSDFVAITTYSGRMRHVGPASWLNHAEFGRVGRGAAACGTAVDAEYYDQVAFNAARARWNPDYVEVLISSLPLCRRCAVKKGKES